MMLKNKPQYKDLRITNMYPTEVNKIDKLGLTPKNMIILAQYIINHIK